MPSGRRAATIRARVSGANAARSRPVAVLQIVGHHDALEPGVADEPHPAAPDVPPLEPGQAFHEALELQDVLGDDRPGLLGTRPKML